MGRVGVVIAAAIDIFVVQVSAQRTLRRGGIEGSASVQSKTEQDVDANGNVTAVREYGFGSGAPGPLYRTTTTTYLATSAYIAKSILNRPTQVTVCPGAAGCSTRWA